MKIAFVTKIAGPHGGGVASVVRELSTMLEKRGTEVIIFHGRDSWSARGIENTIGDLPWTLAKREICIVHLHGLWSPTTVLGGIYSHAAKVPYVVSPHAMLAAWALRHKRFRKALALRLQEGFMIRRASCLHALTAKEAEDIRRCGFRNHVAVIGNAVRLPAATQSNRSTAGPRTLLYLGRLHPVKGLEALIDGWALARIDRGGWQLRIVGWGASEYVRSLEQRCIDLAAASIDIEGPLFGEDKAAAFRSANGFVLPSQSEGLPMAALEAWSFGLPVIMTPACNLPIGFERDAAMVIESEPGSIAQRLRQLAALDSARLREIGENGRRIANEVYGWDRISAQFEELYAWVLGEAARPAFVF